MNVSVTLEPITFRPAGEIAKDMRRGLKIFDTYYGRVVQSRFAAGGPGWAPRKEAEGAADPRERSARALAEHKVKLKLASQLRRAQQRFARGKGTEASVIRRALVFEEFKRQVAKESEGLLRAPRALTPAQKKLLRDVSDQSAFYAGGDKRLERSVRGLRERVGRAELKVSGRVLGRMASAQKSKIGGAVLEVRNTIEWSAAQNEGATVGHGAQLPARSFNYFTATDGEVFSEIMVNLMVVALG